MKNKFITSTIILLVGGLITKILGMFIKIIMTRNIGIDGLSLYMLILPTMSLFINLSQFGLPIALSRLIALNTMNNKKLFFSIIPITIIMNILISIIIILISPIISNNLLHNNTIKLGVIAISLIIPFTTLSSICRSYFFGKEKMFPHILSLIIENIIRLLFMVIILPKIVNLKLEYIIFFLVASNIISELTSTIILVLFLPKNVNIKINDLKPNINYIYDSFKLGIPNVTSNLIYSLSFFLEPIILTNILTNNYSINYIVREYGIISGYVIPLLTLPSFFTLAISQAIMPYITKEYSNKNTKNIRKTITIITIIILIFGTLITIIFELQGKTLLKIIYKTNLGYYYLKILSPIFIFQYIQSIFIFTLNAIGKNKVIFYLSIISLFARSLSIIILSFFHIGIYPYIISIFINIIISTLYLVKKTINYLY